MIADLQIWQKEKTNLDLNMAEHCKKHIDILRQMQNAYRQLSFKALTFIGNQFEMLYMGSNSTTHQ